MQTSPTCFLAVEYFQVTVLQALTVHNISSVWWCVGGCVQEEIRFSICPELVAAMVVSPVMTAAEAIEIIGGEQYSAYAGYGWSLRYKGDFKDTCAVDADGTVLNGITAIDALDGRRGNFDFEYQLRCFPHFYRYAMSSIDSWSTLTARCALASTTVI